MSGASPLGVPESPSSSKRSRSRDSSLASSSQSTPGANTPIPTPSASAPSLIIPSNTSPNWASNPGSPQDPTPYPAFLRLNKAEAQKKFYDLEWEQRRRLQVGRKQDDSEQQSEWAHCPLEEISNRNRYANVNPYQGNRVKLRVPEGHSDYINASPIVLESTKSKKVTRFIATQGPKTDIISHLWRMIWHETASPAVIVMLTQTHEGSREKCAPYYPLSEAEPELHINAHDEFEDGFTHTVKLVSLDENQEARAEIRELDMVSADGSESKKVWHLLFAGWPDFLIPEGSDREALMRLIDLSREKNAVREGDDNPRIVHCSAGVGRSGTFIALDWLMRELDEGSLDEVPDTEDPIYNVVDCLRKQRMMMVQGEQQYWFLYDVMREKWRERWARAHPEEAERLGIGAVRADEHKAKKAKSGDGDEGELSDAPMDEQLAGDEDEHAEVEAELADAETAFEQGKT